MMTLAVCASMVALAACSGDSEPEVPQPEPQPEEPTYYKVTVTTDAAPVVLDEEAEEGDQITLTAPDDIFFLNWASEQVEITDNKFTMPAEDVEVMAVYETNALNFIPDAVFKQYCVEEFDRDDNGELSREECLKVTAIFVAQTGVESIDGIEVFSELITLYCEENNISSLDVSRNLALQDFHCYDNNISTIDVSKNIELTNLGVAMNNLTTLDVSKNTKLETLDCYENKLATLDISKNLLLGTNGGALYCGYQKDVAQLVLTIDPSQTERWEDEWSQDTDNNDGVVLATR